MTSPLDGFSFGWAALTSNNAPCAPPGYEGSDNACLRLLWPDLVRAGREFRVAGRKREGRLERHRAGDLRARVDCERNQQDDDPTSSSLL